ncbi:hypothetical protein O181_070490 [Austropuccinia psidii MF-1]|uniref:Retrovirus-related Pol polyprotein from transposon TNT 1-94-like beta-barrel domain-containing protein n=1 Tax=Austropuccinia psidii MF-1 TaxID=1389203 RepID=A0A9Q3EWK6_9BASI|nr:hypothetical protein [Austropuccinia psidii MF-1]
MLHLRTLFSSLTISPEDVIDSIIAMWVIINLPERFKMAIESNTNPNNQTLIASKPNSNSYPNQQQKRKSDGDYPRCAPRWHNPLTRHDKSECNILIGDKNTTRNQKPIKSLIESTNKLNHNSIILDSGATTSMFNNPKIFTKISKLTQTIELADGSTILASGTGTVQIRLSHYFLDISDCLLVENLS